MPLWVFEVFAYFVLVYVAPVGIVFLVLEYLLTSCGIPVEHYRVSLLASIAIGLPFGFLATRSDPRKTGLYNVLIGSLVGMLCAVFIEANRFKLDQTHAALQGSLIGGAGGVISSWIGWGVYHLARRWKSSRHS
jgi:hypothetical protein